MIVDNLSNLNLYASVNKRFAVVLRYLEEIDLRTLADGRYVIDSDDAYMSIVSTSLRSKEEALLETHDQYTDIQIVLSGEEVYGWRARSECKSLRDSYSAQNDITFYNDAVSTYVSLKAEQMVIFFPNDAHAPLVGDGAVRKCIIKVRNL